MLDILQAEVVQVIRIRTKRGTGSKNDPVRIVVQYWDLEGRFLTEDDPFCPSVITVEGKDL